MNPWDDTMVLQGQRASSIVPSKVYGDDRRCLDEECTTMLSRYNPSKYCSIHGMDPAEKRTNFVTGRARKNVAAAS